MHPGPQTALRVIVAPDSFKGTADAGAVAGALAEGWRHVRPVDRVTLLPQADGGEGTLDALAVATEGARWHTVADVCGPDHRPVSARWLELPGGIGVAELAESSGLPMMTDLDPAGATSRGLGEVIAAALDHGVQGLVIGLGGSASTDAGAGVLAALGFEFFDGRGDPVDPRTAGDLARITDVASERARSLPPGGVEVLTDTLAPLTGPTGAAHTFGAQKGADAVMRAELDELVSGFAAVVGPARGIAADEPGAGAAGGVGFALRAWGGALVPGAQRINELSRLTAAVRDADLVITGEGRFDATSETGKLVGTVLELCRAHAVRTVVIAGQLAAPVPDLGISLSEVAGSAEAARLRPLRYARAAAAQIAAGVSDD
ncbi:glycerate kinase [Gordonia caeni]|uniref:Glycerate kinase n=1 Tax=Gordonia caeni TaxID=1007097 RepID=A0ABP7NR52_9ACTN